MKTYQVTASALAALLLVACGASSKHASAPERAEQAEDDKAKAQEEAREKKEEADKARADAQDAARAQREADQNAQWAAQRAAQAERDAHPAPAAGVVERQADGAGPVASPNGVVSFATSRAELSAEGKATLDEIARSLRAHPSHTVIIEGYSDETGTESTDIQLSRQRADTVAHYLESDGVSADRVTTKGFGSHHPVSKDDTSRGRALNRRVEVLIQAK